VTEFEYLPFRDWLMTHRDDPTPVGKIARSVLADRCAVYTSGDLVLPIKSPGNLRGHIKQNHTRAADVLDALHEASEAWRRERRALRTS
jgi:hypothetical protein